MNPINTILTSNIANIAKALPVKKLQIHNSEIVAIIETKNILDVLLFFKNNIFCQFKVLTFISCSDYPARKYRFEIVYDLLSVKYNTRIRIKMYTNEISPIDSSQEIFSASTWFEREIWDMFGVFFKGHETLNRILTDYGFIGHPLRKDFPLSGFIEVRYCETKKRITIEPLELSQEYRTFAFLSPWETQKI